ncbi:hemerythrin domain-containing protein [Ornithinimicrobium avium]|uniref:Cation-binding protein n=1 Tax=Ornithinimicrobium avium TaxID=2283195 RepID=A0A345NIJ9_9MICO|nr:hemerythrin domain-containing protein [Ornithinimicrobium avium]AXH94857.1 cation-binding protein [Ornithinimicrobium avium]
MPDFPIPRPVSGDVVDLILQDHRLFESLMREMRDSTADRAAAREAFADVLVAHGEAEEHEVYPRLERRTEDVDAEEVHHGEHEHAQINEALLALLECRGTDTQKFDDAVEKMNEVLQHHVTEEELTILNPAREEVGEEERATLGEAFLRARSEQLDQRPGSEDNVRRLVEEAHEKGLLPAQEEGGS